MDGIAEPWTAVTLSIGLVLTAYLLGSIPWGLVLTRWVVDEDIRANGSGNIGATNTARIAGRKIGALTLLLDMLKGGLPVLSAKLMGGITGPWSDWLVAIVALSAFAGHLFPLYLGFKTGGKGVATTLGEFMVISPFACVCAMTVFCLMVWRFRFVSLASLSGVMILPVYVLLRSYPSGIIFASVVMTMFIFFRHRDNIKRLIRGTEPAWGKSGAVFSRKRGSVC